MIEATYKVSESEFVEAQKLWCTPAVKKLPGRWILQTASIIFGCFVGWSLHYLPPWLIAGVCLSLLSIQAITYWRKGLLRKYNYQRNAARMETIQVTIDDAGYRDERESLCGGWMSWPSFNGWMEGRETFVLGRFLTFITIPKAALSEEQQSELRALMLEKIGPCGVLRTDANSSSTVNS